MKQRALVRRILTESVVIIIQEVVCRPARRHLNQL